MDHHIGQTGLLTALNAGNTDSLVEPMRGSSTINVVVDKSGLSDDRLLPDRSLVESILTPDLTVNFGFWTVCRSEMSPRVLEHWTSFTVFASAITQSIVHIMEIIVGRCSI